MLTATCVHVEVVAAGNIVWFSWSVCVAYDCGCACCPAGGVGVVLATNVEGAVVCLGVGMAAATPDGDSDGVLERIADVLVGVVVAVHPLLTVVSACHLHHPLQHQHRYHHLLQNLASPAAVTLASSSAEPSKESQ